MIQLSLSHTTCHHLYHRLTCEKFDELIAGAGGKCEICRVTLLRPWIDHDHKDANEPSAGVRGLVCPKCNAHLRRVDSGERPALGATARFLDRYRMMREVRGDPLWTAAMTKADERGEYLSEVIRAALEKYVKSKA